MFQMFYNKMILNEPWCFMRIRVRACPRKNSSKIYQTAFTEPGYSLQVLARNSFAAIANLFARCGLFAPIPHANSFLYFKEIHSNLQFYKALRLVRLI